MALNEQVQRMANYLCEVALTNRPLKTQIGSVGEGAVVEFFGNVRPLENGRPITAIEYEAHLPMAEHQLGLITHEAGKKFGLLAVTLHHRIGWVPAGGTSLFLRVTSLHRGAAFEAGQWIIDELKTRVPIWKRPVFADNPAAVAELSTST
jgi:molybdopterin synthase catalytic subunit